MEEEEIGIGEILMIEQQLTGEEDQQKKFLQIAEIIKMAHHHMEIDMIGLGLAVG